MWRIALVAAALALTACQREQRSFSRQPMPEQDTQIAMSSLSPGQDHAVGSSGRFGERFENNAYQMAQGKRLFEWFNCTGCHGHGGGGSGPALMDDKWIYGGQIANIVASIREGRPNGMPSFRGKIPEEQIWQIAAYVRSLGGNVAKDAAPGRDDDMQAHPAENRLPAQPPVPGGTPPPASQMPN